MYIKYMCDTLPLIYNKSPVVNKWCELGCSIKDYKKENIVYFENYKLCKVENGYVLLCSRNGCPCIIVKENLCEKHNNKELYQICRISNCGENAIFGNSLGKPLYCFKHKNDGMFNVKNKRPRNQLNSNINSICLHDLNIVLDDDIVNNLEFMQILKNINFMVTKKICCYPQCQTNPVFGFKGCGKQFCRKHKLNGMINLYDKKCEYDNCDTLASFGYTTNKKQFCYKHKLSGMINFKNKTCMELDCVNRASFGVVDGKVEYCSKHKLNGMINLTNIKCEYKGCNKNPSFGYVGYERQYCVEHKLDKMVNISVQKCLYNGCVKKREFGYLGFERQYCLFHKLDDMVKITHQKCLSIGCKNKPIYGYPDIGRKYCLIHKLDDMIDTRKIS